MIKDRFDAEGPAGRFVLRTCTAPRVAPEGPQVQTFQQANDDFEKLFAEKIAKIPVWNDYTPEEQARLKEIFMRSKK